ncbi:MAG: hypothetical protein CMH27_09830 [Micavibrio sp.]|nr:hypothetical protein [Micavibrio sp.]|tara:strand:- start:361 stop:1410 length:1050 start_codon:yes stop_codon:yes gene_type:complete
MADIQNKYIKAAQEADMSLCGEFTHAAYDQTYAAVMDDPSRDAPELLIAAACANMDIVFGEDHRDMASTMEQIMGLTKALPGGHIKAIALEYPVEMQEVFDPVIMRDIGFEDFLRKAFLLDLEATRSLADDMMQSGDIRADQHAYLMNKLQTQVEMLLNVPDLENMMRGSSLEGLYQMVKTAAEHGVPVIAADMHRERLIGIRLANPAMPYELRMSDDDFDALFNQGVDDRSDVERIKDMGVDLDGPGILLVHRGYAHINGTGFGASAGVEQTNGIDDILERSGREVVTVEIGSIDVPDRSVPDPADLSLAIDDMGRPVLDRSVYEEQKAIGDAPETPVPTSSPDLFKP